MITEHREPAGTAIAVGRYLLHGEIARGGMATVHLARLIGDEGFSRIVAAKRLHPRLAEDEGFLAMFLAEARITSKLRHRNIVPVLDVVTSDGQVVLVQEYVHGAPLHWLLDQARLEGRRVPIEIALSIACQVLSGLHAAHVLTDELGQPLDVVHRDVSPHNVMIATDGTARLLDFGVAKTSVATHPTQAGTYQGKVAYSAPEQLRGAAMPQSDVYSLAVVLWELLVGQRMYEPRSESELVVSVLNGQRPAMREILWKKAASIPSETWAQLEVLVPIVERGLALSIADRWSTAEELELALRAAITPAPASAVARWLEQHGKDYLELHERAIAAEESSWRARPVRRAAGSTPPQTFGLPPIGTQLPRDSLKAMPAGKTLPVPPDRAAAPAHSMPEWRGHGAVVAVLAALIIAALAGIVLVMRSSSHEAAAPALVPASEPAQRMIFRPGPRPPAPSPPPRDLRDTASRDSPATGSSSATGDLPAAREPSPPTTRSVRESAPARPASRPGSRPQVRAPAARTVAKPRPEVAPAPVKPEVRPAPDAVDCTPPYYYEGAKKLFKPACL